MDSESITKTKEEITIPNFTQKEHNNYTRQKDKAHFSSPEEEYKYEYNLLSVNSSLQLPQIYLTIFIN